MATNRPSVAVMINDAIATLNEKGGSSLHAIKKYIAVTYMVDVQKLDSHLKKALKKGVESGSLTKPTGKGATGSFKLADKPKTTKKPVAGKEKVAAHPKEKKAAKEVKANAVRVSPKNVRANKAVPNNRASKPSAIKKAVASKKALEKAKVAEVEEKEEVESISDPDGFLNMLRIDLVVEELLQHFSVKGMKILSLVSKDALIAVRGSKVFSRRVQFQICGESLRARVLNNCFHSWKTVKFGFEGFNLKRLGWLTGDTEDTQADCIPASPTILQSLHSVQSFSADLVLHSNNVTSDFLRRKLNGFVQKIMEVSNETLEDLELGIFSSILKEIRSIQLPNLKRLNLWQYGNVDYGGETEGFMRNLPPLEKLTINVRHLSKLFSALQGRMSQLRELNVKIDCDSCEDSTFDWNIVAEMARLEDISIYLIDSRCKTCVQGVEELLLRIPAKTVTRISLHSLLEREIRFIGESIRPFAKLTELYLVNLQSFDDQSLQSIIKGCPKLKKIGLRYIKNVTDFGFSGVRKSPPGDAPLHLAWYEQGVPLTNLKDLTSLHMHLCGVISVATLLEVVQFQFLTSIYYDSPVQDWEGRSPREFLLQILQQNPSLNEIDFLAKRNRWDPPTHHRCLPLEDEARRLFPRIKQIQFSHNPDIWR